MTHTLRGDSAAKLWDGPGWDKVGIKFTGSQPDPNFLPSLAPTYHTSALVDISTFLYLKYLNCIFIIEKQIKFLCHWLNWHHNSEFSSPSPRSISFFTSPFWDMRALKKTLSSILFAHSGVCKKTNCLLCIETRNKTLTSLNSQPHKITENHKCDEIHKISVQSF